MLSNKFAVCELPLDLSDEDLWSEGPQLQNALQRLDNHGWNLDKSFRESSLTRARLLIAVIRDEILELSLNTSVNSVDQQVR